MSDVLAGKNVKQATKARALEGVNTAKAKAAQRVQKFAITGQGRKRSRSTTHTPKTRHASASATKRTAKKRKASASPIKRKQTKRPRTSPRDIFG